jgi:hypothetical protein
MGSMFFPMWRVERVAKDESVGGVKSLCAQAEQRTGTSLDELMNTGEVAEDGPLV